MDKLLSLLGLARRAGKVEPGFDAAVSAARSGKAHLLLAARDISEKTVKNLRYEGDRAGTVTVRLTCSMEELGRACGARAGVLAVTDKGFAKAIGGLAGAATEDKEEHAHDD
ncbi:MAG: L7Ae/L30e/S12e/Gadd45 family ribosomal protein [Acutalibacter sp.]|jgi:ribosomal protein L7Ae-like RNA K-turn-binding protein